MIHLVKLCVGIRDPSQLRRYVVSLNAAAGDVLAIRTRSTPKRLDELLDGGSLYWVMGGAIRARQRIVGIATVDEPEGRKHCVLSLEPEVRHTSSAAYRPFQGWRYLEADRAPPDMHGETDDMPEEMRKALADLGLA